MNLDNLIEIVNTGEIDRLKSILEVSKYAYFIGDAVGYTQYQRQGVIQKTGSALTISDLQQYNPKQHQVHNPFERKDKDIKDADEVTVGKAPVWRLSLPEQKKIVLLAATFLGSPEIVSNPNTPLEVDLLSVLNTISEDNKLDYKFKQISKITMSERECAELWYTQPAEDDYWEGTPMEGNALKLRMRVISPSLGDTLYPVWDEYGDMIAFGRYYETIQTTSGLLVDQSKTYHFDIYTKDTFYYLTKVDSATVWTTETKASLIGKIPVIYYSQPITEWSDVQEMIDRLENKTSNHADTNDYFDSPIVFTSGKIKGWANKGETGKVLEGVNDAKMTYVTWDSAPESMKMEIENLGKYIKYYTSTPDISFDNMKGFGRVSGIALKLLFMDAHLKASDKEETFGQSVQRRYNYLKSAISVIEAKFKAAQRLRVLPKFTYFLPEDTEAEVNTLIAAYKAGIISLESAVKANPLVTDAVNELELIGKEADAAFAKQQALIKQQPSIIPKPNGVPVN